MRNSLSPPFSLFVAPSSLEYATVQKGLNAELQEPQFKLMTCGVGESQARLFCQKIETLPISCLVLLGWAGGLTPDLAACDLVCADSAIYAGQPKIDCQTLPIKDIRTGPILTVAKALLTPQEKRSAQSGGAIAVEMEAYPLAAWANRRGIPFIHARVILDTLDESIPDIDQGMDSAGGVRVFPFLKQLAKKPILLSDLWQLNKRVRLVNPALEKLALEVLRTLTSKGSRMTKG